jgi:hypothetical protein
MTLACKKINKTRSYINKSDVHWRIRWKQSWRTSFCAGIDIVKGHKGGERCCAGRTTIHRSAVGNTISHKGVDNGKSTMKANGDGVVRSKSDSKKKTCNLRQSYTFGKRY